MASMASPSPSILHKKFPTLYGTDQHGKIKMWEASVYTTSEGFAISTIEFGYIDGKHQIASRTYDTGKNIGKKNETTPLMQCINETQRKWTDKRDKESYKENSIGTTSDGNNNNVASQSHIDEKQPIFPMLAQTYDPHSTKNKKHPIIFPCLVQPKLDGLRCVVYVDCNGTIRFQSRTGSFFETLGHIEEELHHTSFFRKNGNIVLDGELYTTEIPFEELAGLIKKKKLTEKDLVSLKVVCYHVYDIIDDVMTFVERDAMLTRLVPGNRYQYIKKVITAEAENVDRFKECFSAFVGEGYEGIMLRNKIGKYQRNHRSNDLQKYKEFMEEEYTIHDYKEGSGRDEGAVIWICQTDDGREFSVRPKGSMEIRREWFQQGSEYIGKKLTVIFQEKSEMGVPRFPVGKSVRDGF
jgi:ATP-dependent DNA ligase